VDDTGVTVKPRVAFAMGGDEQLSAVFSKAARSRLDLVADVISDKVLTEFSSVRSLQVLNDVDALITGWGSPVITESVLELAPRLRLIAHSAGTVKAHIDRTCWDRGITVTTAAQANGIPVAQFTLAFILLAGKRTFDAARALHVSQASFAKEGLAHDVGNNGSTVGIIGASRIGRLVIEHLQPFGFTVLLADPTVSDQEAARLGVQLVGLDDLMAGSSVVSLHAPVLPSTIGMIAAKQLAAMKNGSTFINTARGALVDHDALRREAASGRISLVLDVTSPEPLPSGDPLYSMPNVILTPHIAGSMGNELTLVGDFAVTEIERFAAGQPNEHVVTRKALDLMA
jgi:phosphoglycerate dehydrogenase-like enzyme